MEPIEGEDKSWPTGEFEIEVEGVNPVVCMMNKICMIFITVKLNLYYIENKLKLPDSTL
jgi:hypothetical protein